MSPSPNQHASKIQNLLQLVELGEGLTTEQLRFLTAETFSQRKLPRSTLNIPPPVKDVDASQRSTEMSDQLQPSDELSISKQQQELTLGQLVIQEQALLKAQRDLEIDYSMRGKIIRDGLIKNAINRDLAHKLVNIAIFERGKQLIEIQGIFDRVSPNRLAQLKRAIIDVAQGCDVIKDRYFATKDFLSFTDQTESPHYDFMPRHGTIMFKVGLSMKGRSIITHDLHKDTILQDHKQALEDMIYYMQVCLSLKKVM